MKCFFSVLVLLALVMSTTLVPGAVYKHDDGGAETVIGFTGATQVWWGNVFETAGATDTITTLQAAFEVEPLFHPDKAFTLYLLDDDDGIPGSGSTLLQSVGGTVDTFDGTFQSLVIPATQVSGYFIVAATAVGLQGQMAYNPAAIDRSTSAGWSWISNSASDGLPTGTLINMHNLIPGNWLLRAEPGQAPPPLPPPPPPPSTPVVPEPVTASAMLLAAGGLVRYLRRRRC